MTKTSRSKPTTEPLQAFPQHNVLVRVLVKPWLSQGLGGFGESLVGTAPPHKTKNDHADRAPNFPCRKRQQLGFHAAEDPHKTHVRLSPRLCGHASNFCSKSIAENRSAHKAFNKTPSQDPRIRLRHKTFTKPPCHQDFTRATKEILFDQIS